MYLFDKTDRNIHCRYEYKTAKEFAIQIDERNAKDDESRRKINELKCKFLMDSKKQIEKNWENK